MSNNKNSAIINESVKRCDGLPQDPYTEASDHEDMRYPLSMTYVAENVVSIPEGHVSTSVNEQCTMGDKVYDSADGNMTKKPMQTDEYSVGENSLDTSFQLTLNIDDPVVNNQSKESDDLYSSALEDNEGSQDNKLNDSEEVVMSERIEKDMNIVEQKMSTLKRQASELQMRINNVEKEKEDIFKSVDDNKDYFIKKLENYVEDLKLEIIANSDHKKETLHAYQSGVDELQILHAKLQDIHTNREANDQEFENIHLKVQELNQSYFEKGESDQSEGYTKEFIPVHLHEDHARGICAKIIGSYNNIKERFPRESLKKTEQERITLRDVYRRERFSVIQKFLNDKGVTLLSPIKIERSSFRKGKDTADMFCYAKKPIVPHLPVLCDINGYYVRIYHDSQQACSICKQHGHSAFTEKCPAYIEQSENVVAFQGHNNPLSNFYPCNLHVFDKDFCSSEQAYQWMKAAELGCDEIADRILQSTHGNEAKRIAREIDVQKVPLWEDYRDKAMREILEAKFYCSKTFKNCLLETGDKILAESTDNKYWATGLFPEKTLKTDPKFWPGKNMLGTLLTELRAKMKQYNDSDFTTMERSWSQENIYYHSSPVTRNKTRETNRYDWFEETESKDIFNKSQSSDWEEEYRDKNYCDEKDSTRNSNEFNDRLESSNIVERKLQTAQGYVAPNSNYVPYYDPAYQAYFYPYHQSFAQQQSINGTANQYADGIPNQQAASHIQFWPPPPVYSSYPESVRSSDKQQDCGSQNQPSKQGFSNPNQLLQQSSGNQNQLPQQGLVNQSRPPVPQGQIPWHHPPPTFGPPPFFPPPSIRQTLYHGSPEFYTGCVNHGPPGKVLPNNDVVNYEGRKSENSASCPEAMVATISSAPEQVCDESIDGKMPEETIQDTSAPEVKEDDNRQSTVQSIPEKHETPRRNDFTDSRNNSRQNYNAYNQSDIPPRFQKTKRHSDYQRSYRNEGDYKHHNQERRYQTRQFTSNQIERYGYSRNANDRGRAPMQRNYAHSSYNRDSHRNDYQHRRQFQSDFKREIQGHVQGNQDTRDIGNIRKTKPTERVARKQELSSPRKESNDSTSRNRKPTDNEFIKSVEQLMNQSDEHIIKWYRTNKGPSDHKQNVAFINILIHSVCSSALSGKKVDSTTIHTRLPLLKTCVNSIGYQVQALWAILEWWKTSNVEMDLLIVFLDIFYKEDVVSKSAFHKWEKTPGEQVLKDKHIKKFLEQLG